MLVTTSRLLSVGGLNTFIALHLPFVEMRRFSVSHTTSMAYEEEQNFFSFAFVAGTFTSHLEERCGHGYESILFRLGAGGKSEESMESHLRMHWIHTSAQDTKKC